MKTSKVMVLAALTAGLAGVSAEAAVIAGYTFGIPTATTLNATTVDVNVTASALTGGTGTTITAVGSISPNYANAPFATAARSNDTAAQNFFQIVVTAASGYELDLSELKLDMSLGGAATPRTVSFRTSVDGLALADPTFTPTVSLTAVRPNTTTYTYDLTAVKYQNLSSFTVRGYISTPTINQNIDLDNIVLSGAAAVVPEPGAVAGLMLGGAALMRRRR